MNRMNKMVLLLLVILSTTSLGCAASQRTTQPTKTESASYTNQAAAKNSLDNLIAAYSTKKIWRFMSFVAEDFTGDAMILEGSVRKDFSTQHNTGIRYTVNNLTFTDKADKASIGITFSRNQIDIKTGTVVNQNGATELIFKREDGIYKLYSQKRPYLFGISEY